MGPGKGVLMKRRLVLLSLLGAILCILGVVLLPVGLVFGQSDGASGTPGQGHQIRFVDPARVAWMLFYGSPAPVVTSGSKAAPDHKSSGYLYLNVTPCTKIPPGKSPTRVGDFKEEEAPPIPTR